MRGRVLGDDDRPLLPSRAGQDKAVAELERCAGTQVDPDVVRAAIVVVGRGAPAPNEALLAARAVVAAAAA